MYDGIYVNNRNMPKKKKERKKERQGFVFISLTCTARDLNFNNKR
jgi:hypothetical protein